MTTNPVVRLLAIAIALGVAAGAGFLAARWATPGSAAPPAQPETSPASAAEDFVPMDAKAVEASGIGTDRPRPGAIHLERSGPSVVKSTPGAEAVLTSRVAGVVVRIGARIGQDVAEGQAVAAVESRDASAITAEVSAARARLTLARQQRDRERHLFEQGVSPRADYEAAEAGLAVAESELRKAEAAARAALTTGDGRTSAVVSPIAGRVVDVPASLGSFVQPETPLVRVVDPRQLQIEVSLPAPEAQDIRVGDRARIVAADGAVLDGRVRSATGVVDPASRHTTVVVVPDTPRGLLPGQLVNATIVSDAEPIGQASAWTVPEDAVQTMRGRDVVFVRQPEGFRAREVRVVRRGQGRAQIEGLSADDELATSNAFLLKAELAKDSAR